MAEVQVVAAIIVADGSILACRRARHKVSGGLWEFPGGKVEAGELPKAALEREIREELGLTVVATGTFDKSITKVSDELTISLECLVVQIPEKLEIESQDHDAFLWLSPSELAHLGWALPDLPAVTRLSSLESFDELVDSLLR
jgi:8-oxo-dGTP diphosphatase